MALHSKKLLFSGLLLFLASCAAVPETPIVREVHQASGVNPASVSEMDLHRWFGDHPGLAHQVSQQCRALTNQPLGWSDTPEGKVCRAVVWSVIEKAPRDGIAF